MSHMPSPMCHLSPELFLAQNPTLKVAKLSRVLLFHYHHPPPPRQNLPEETASHPFLLPQASTTCHSQENPPNFKNSSLSSTAFLLHSHIAGKRRKTRTCTCTLLPICSHIQSTAKLPPIHPSITPPIVN